MSGPMFQPVLAAPADTASAATDRTSLHSCTTQAMSYLPHTLSRRNISSHFLYTGVGIMQPVTQQQNQEDWPTFTPTPQTLSSNSSSSQNSAGEDGLASCRICLEPITTPQLQAGKAVALGCRCAVAIGTMHYDCAVKWFGGSRRSTVCEVCCAECTTLPPALKLHISNLPPLPMYDQSQAPNQPGITVLQAAEQSANPYPFNNVPTYLAVYAVFCLLPGLLFSLASLFVTFKVIGAGIAVTMGVTVVLSSLTILHWVYAPTAHVAHLAWVVLLLATSASCELIFRAAVPGVGPDLHAVLGGITGLSLAIILKCAVVGPLLKRYQHVFTRCCCTCGRRAAQEPSTRQPSVVGTIIWPRQVVIVPVTPDIELGNSVGESTGTSPEPQASTPA